MLIAEYDRRGGWQSWECMSCAHWLSWKCGISIRTAQEHVRVARALEELPVMTAAFAAGQLSYSKVRAMTRVATPKSEADLVEVARHGTASHVDRIVAGYRQVERNMDPDRGRAQLHRRGVWYQTNDDGTVTITIRGGPDSIALVKQAIEAAMPEVPKPIDQPDAPRAARRFDALEHVTRVYLEPDEHAAPRTEVVVHADLETLAEDEPGRCQLEDGTGLSAATLQRLTCDSGLRLALDERGKTLDIGRRSRTIPPAMRRAIIDRDQSQCRFPGCTMKGRLQIHHGQHWSRRGHTKKPNLILVCLYHHKVLHEGGWQVTGDAGGALTNVDPHGRPMPEVSLPPPQRPTPRQSDASMHSPAPTSPPTPSTASGPVNASTSTTLSAPSGTSTHPPTTDSAEVIGARAPLRALRNPRRSTVVEEVCPASACSSRSSASSRSPRAAAPVANRG